MTCLSFNQRSEKPPDTDQLSEGEFHPPRLSSSLAWTLPAADGEVKPTQTLRGLRPLPVDIRIPVAWHKAASFPRVRLLADPVRPKLVYPALELLAETSP
jgi:hypothetical protein